MNHTTRKWTLRLVVILYLGLLVGLPVGYLFIKAFSNGFHAFWVEVTKPNAVAALKLSGEVALIAVPVNTIVGVGAALLLAKRKVLRRAGRSSWPSTSRSRSRPSSSACPRAGLFEDRLVRQLVEP
jgi:ABC-type sulfate transport system permease subunit